MINTKIFLQIKKTTLSAKISLTVSSNLNRLTTVFTAVSLSESPVNIQLSLLQVTQTIKAKYLILMQFNFSLSVKIENAA